MRKAKAGWPLELRAFWYPLMSWAVTSADASTASTPVSAASWLPAASMVCGTARTSRFSPAARTTPKVDSIQLERGSARKASYDSGGIAFDFTRAERAARKLASAVSPCGVVRRRVSPITDSGVTSEPKRSVATRAISRRCSESVPGPAIVAEVPTYCRRGDSSWSRIRRQSMATSAPCRPR